MEKGQESKQKRKTPLTTIAISQEYAQKLDEYLKGRGITRKEFVELSVDYFQRTGFDLRYSMSNKWIVLFFNKLETILK